MKKILLITLLSFAALFSKAQNTVTLEAGTSPLSTYQLRYKAVTPDSLNHLWIYNGITLKYNQVYTATEANQRFAPAGSGVTSVLGTTNRVTVSPTSGIPVINISATFEALLEKVANKATSYATVNNTLYPTIQLMRDSTLHPNKNLYDLANKTIARANLGLAIGTDVLAYRTFGTAANNNTSDFEVPLTFTYGLNRTSNTVKADSAVLKSKASALADYNILITALGGKQTSLSGTGFLYFTGTTPSYVTGNGSGNVVQTTSPTLVTPTLGIANATSLNITGTGGAGYISLINTSSITAPTVGVKIYGRVQNRFAFMGNNGFEAMISSNSLTGVQVAVLPDASGLLMTNPLTTTGDIPYLSANSTTGTNVARLPIGADGSLFSVASGLPTYVAQSTITSGNSTLWNNETITTAAKASGDIMQYDGSKWVNATVSVTAPLVKSGAGAGGTWSITQADATHNGYVSSTDWNTFNNKANLATTPQVVASANLTAQTASGTICTYTVGASNESLTLQMYHNVTTTLVGTLNYQVTFTDINNVAVTYKATIALGTIVGYMGVAPGSGSNNNVFINPIIRAKAGTVVTLITTGTLTSGVFDVGGTITKVN